MSHLSFFHPGMVSENTIYRPSVLEVDLSAVAHNVRVFRSQIPADGEILAVVKADGYGHGALEVLKIAIAEGVAWAGVALVEEGIRLRKAGIEIPLILLGEWFPEAVQAFYEHRITPVLYSFETARWLNDYAKSRGEKIKVHLKLDTGMGRIGFLPDQVSVFLKEEFPFLLVDGVMSHLSSADEGDDAYSLQQHRLFLKLLAEIEKKHSLSWIHIANSAGTIDFEFAKANLFRLGIALYGQPPSSRLRNKLDWKEAISWKTKVGHLQWFEKGAAISYGRTYVTQKRTRIATIPVGYADGYSRLLSNKASVLIRGKRVPVVGRVCMDMTMIDVTSLPEVEILDEVTLIGRQGSEYISATEMADWLGTITYEVVCAISNRVPRYYIKAP